MSVEASRIDGLFELAFRRHQAGELREAEELYRSILAADPRQLDCLYYLGMIALQEGKPEAAIDLIGQAIASNDGIANYQAGIAEAYARLGDRGRAIAHFRKAAAIEPRHWAAHHELGTLLFDQGDANAALEHATRALALRDTPSGRELFVRCVDQADRLPPVPEFRGLITRALREAWARPAELAGAAIAVIRGEPTVARGMQAAMAAWPRRLPPPEMAQPMGVLAQDELAGALLDATPVTDAALERLLTSARTILLDAATQAKSEVSREMVNFAVSLARQCFINEYVFDVSDTERQAIAWLRMSVRQALERRSPVFAIHLIALAAYAPLHALDRDDGILSRNWIKPLDALITEQVREPKAEAALRAAIPSLTDISDAVSREVRDQYEANPYPRWVSLDQTAPAPSIEAHLRGLLPHAQLRPLAEPAKPEILIAGCGTGQQSIGTAQRFPAAHVLAVDLSLASLAYAKRKSGAVGVAIEYVQADIVALDSDRRFDMIESTGVLHHLADPMLGFGKLVGLLKPGGVMRIGLYSEIGRRNIVELRQVIAERNYQATEHDIRRFRQELLSRPEPRFASLLHSTDFCSMSACRDLLFHVQEHRLTLPQIAAFLGEHGLTMLGFELPGIVLARYRTQFPNDATLTDLTNWHRFETENPDTFTSMYQFWLQKG
jgi:trans-aconitate methyltransferase/tetratricopeptide (TPR) repeat protein